MRADVAIKLNSVYRDPDALEGLRWQYNETRKQQQMIIPKTQPICNVLLISIW